MLVPCSQSRRSMAASCIGSVSVPTIARRVSPALMSACSGNGRLASRTASTPPILPVPSIGTFL